jgi:CO dehydrogenase nickel-insertion accessory protein CooC1
MGTGLLHKVLLRFFEVYLDEITRAIKTSNNIRELFKWPGLLMVLRKLRFIINNVAENRKHIAKFSEGTLKQIVTCIRLAE